MTTHTTPAPGRLARLLLALALLAPLLALVSASTAPPAGAFEVPPVASPGAGHVTADALPTVQINGVVWDQHIIGDTVYVAGEFTHARPAGSPPGANQVPRANLLAFDIRTGQLISSFVANANAQVRVVTSSPDGSRLYVGGQFTSINGTPRYRIAALDPATGAVIPSFNARTDYIVFDIEATDSVVYAGGKFNRANGTEDRINAAAFSASNGAVLPWAPDVNERVFALGISPDGSRVFLGGKFTRVNGQIRRGMAAVDAQTGAVLPFGPGDHVWWAGPDGGMTDLRIVGNHLYAAGYTFGRNAGNLEGVVKVDLTTDEIEWIEDCHGDTYQLAPINGHVYVAGHFHFCGNVGASTQSSDEHTQWGEYMRHSMSFVDAVAGQIRRDNWSYHNLEGFPAPSRTSWAPDWQVGDYTGLGQATWAVEANEEYVVFGGEFTRVNNQAQQGLVRYAVRSIAPNDERPRHNGSNFPIKAVSTSPGDVRVTLRATYDRDDHVLTYDLLRNGTVVQSQDVASTFWDQPTVAFFERGLTPGSTITYRVRATDSTGNSVTSEPVSVTVATSGTRPRYADQVIADGARLYWRLGDAPGSSTASDEATFNHGSVNAMTFGRPGAILGDPDTAASPSGTSSRVVQPPLVNSQGLDERHPTEDEFTIEIWFRTSSSQGGRLLGFGNSRTGTSSSSQADRVLFVNPQGRVMFGVRTRPEGSGLSGSRQNRTVQSGTGYNDGQWHHAVATLSGDGMRLYVDGELVASRNDVNSGHGYYGYWRVGADTLSGWSSGSQSTRLNGDLDEAAVYHHALTPEQIRQHWVLSGRAGNQAPEAAFSVSVST